MFLKVVLPILIVLTTLTGIITVLLMRLSRFLDSEWSR